MLKQKPSARGKFKMISLLAFLLTSCCAIDPCYFFVISGHHGEQCKKVQSQFVLRTKAYEAKIHKSVAVGSTESSSRGKGSEAFFKESRKILFSMIDW